MLKYEDLEDYEIEGMIASECGVHIIQKSIVAIANVQTKRVYFQVYVNHDLKWETNDLLRAVEHYNKSGGNK